ncbi:MAG: serine/threonine-protein phosphatase [Candidatus Kerfeldbacteria bacterium]|nr:serine/threonine-protein phosphatase [Candidatus Kerfeldbacteria bacterium]
MAVEGEPHSPEPREREGGLRFAFESVKSERHPERNEDEHLELPEQQTFAVFDGMSIPRGGEIAARIAKQSLEHRFGRLPTGASLEQNRQLLDQILREAHEVVVDYAQANKQFEGFGSTAVVARLHRSAEGKYSALVGNVGDSRAYVLRRGGLEQVTIDDSFIFSGLPEQEQRALQKKFSEVTAIDQLSPRELELWNRRNTITNSLVNNGTPRIYEIALEPSDTLLLASDAISDNLTDTEIASILMAAGSPENAAHALIVVARRRSREKGLRAKPDDMTAIVVEIPS